MRLPRSSCSGLKLFPPLFQPHMLSVRIAAAALLSVRPSSRSAVRPSQPLCCPFASQQPLCCPHRSSRSAVRSHRSSRSAVRPSQQHMLSVRPQPLCCPSVPAALLSVLPFALETVPSIGFTKTSFLTCYAYFAGNDTLAGDKFHFSATSTMAPGPHAELQANVKPAFVPPLSAWRGASNTRFFCAGFCVYAAFRYSAGAMFLL